MNGSYRKLEAHDNEKIKRVLMSLMRGKKKTRTIPMPFAFGAVKRFHIYGAVKMASFSHLIYAMCKLIQTNVTHA